jgi:hypothetical protein
MEHWWKTSYSLSSTHYTYQKYKWLKPGSLPKAIAPSELGEQWMENNFHTSEGSNNASLSKHA